MKKFSKVASTAIAAVLAGAMVIGCTPVATPPATPAPAADAPATPAEPAPAPVTPAEPAPADEPAPAAEPAPAEAVTLNLGIYPADTDQALIDSMEIFIAEYAKARPDVELVRDHYKYAVDTFVPMAEAGNTPTIFEGWFTETKKLMNSGYVRDVTDLLAARGWADKINPGIADLLSDGNGRLYGTPRDGYALGLMLNVELFEEAGLMDANGVPMYPKTWEELATTAQTIKETTGAAGLDLLAQDNAGGWHFANIAWAFGANLITDNGDGTFIPHLNTPEVAAAMEYVKSLKWTYNALTDDPTVENWGTGFQQLGTGGAAMYIAANDAVEQPTANNGLPVDKLALVPIPAGPGGQFSLYGGTPYMFAADATDAEVDAALDFLIVMGKSPDVTPDAIAGLEADATTRVANGTPVIPRFPCWNAPELTAAENEIIAAHSNVNMAFYNDYYAATLQPGNVRPEDPGLTQDMYAEFTKVMQAVLTDESAEVQPLLDTAQANYQALLNDAGMGQ